jgi:phosphoribosylformimino-5-aminoimidazole carboxamide ribotide isomerase
MRLIPAVDLIGGRCVRLVRGDFGSPRFYERDVSQLLQHYRSIGASWAHVVDLDGARGADADNRSLILSLAEQCSLRLQVGGGIRSEAAIDELLDHGVARAVVGSVAVESPEEVANWLQRFGPERLCLAFDVRIDQLGTPRVRTRGWLAATGLSLWEALAPFSETKLAHVLCTDIECDGTLDGPNVALYREARHRFPELEWQTSGGIRSAADLAALAELGVSAAISGRALLEDRIPTEELRPFLPDASFPASTFETVS